LRVIFGAFDACGVCDVKYVDLAVERLGSIATVAVATIAGKDEELILANSEDLGLGSCARVFLL
jgi:hypothetical protein